MRLLMLGLLLTTTAGAVTTLKCAPDSQFRAGGTDTGQDNEPPVLAHISKAAVFPNPASFTNIATPFTMKCPKFTASATLHTFTISGNMQDIWPRLGPASPDGPPGFDTSEYASGRVNILFDGHYEFPNIMENWLQAGIFATVSKGKLTFVLDRSADIYFKAAIIAARINGGKLQPIWFNTKLTQVSLGPRDVVEFYARPTDEFTSVAVKYMKIDFGRGAVTVRNDIPFPSK